MVLNFTLRMVPLSVVSCSRRFWLKHNKVKYLIVIEHFFLFRNCQIIRGNARGIYVPQV